jgi:hypothetical protein
MTVLDDDPTPLTPLVSKPPAIFVTKGGSKFLADKVCIYSQATVEGQQREPHAVYIQSKGAAHTPNIPFATVSAARRFADTLAREYGLRVQDTSNDRYDWLRGDECEEA